MTRLCAACVADCIGLILCVIMKKILLVDDDLTSLDIVALLLEKSGYEVVRVNDSRLALDSFREASPDLVLIDIMMPEVSGVEVTEKIRSESIVPIIAFTACMEELTHQEVIAAGASALVTKPLNRLSLVGMIDKYIEQCCVAR